MKGNCNVVDPVGRMVSRVSPCVGLVLVLRKGRRENEFVVYKKSVKQIAVVTLLLFVVGPNTGGVDAAKFGVEVTSNEEGGIGVVVCVKNVLNIIELIGGRVWCGGVVGK